MLIGHFIIVLPAKSNPWGVTYRGIDRLIPIHTADTSVPSGIQDVWEEENRSHEEDEDWWGFLPSLDLAQHFQRRYVEHGCQCEIVAVYACESERDVREAEKLPGYLGLDVTSTSPDSALQPERIWRPISTDGKVYPLLPIWTLEHKYFQSRLNENGLLTSFEDATLLRDLKITLGQLDPSAGEPSGVEILAIRQV